MRRVVRAAAEATAPEVVTVRRQPPAFSNASPRPRCLLDSLGFLPRGQAADLLGQAVATDGRCIPTGFEPLDRVLRGGLYSGAITEVRFHVRVNLLLDPPPGPNSQA